MISLPMFKKLLNNLNTKCEFCNKKIKRKSAFYEKVKLMEFVYPQKAPFCNEDCCNKYKEYEENSIKRVSLCPSCPTHPDAGPKIN